MRVRWNTYPSPIFSVQKSIRQSTDQNVSRNVSVVISTATTTTKWWYSCVWQEWGVSVRVRSVGSVGHVWRGSQGKGGLVANASQKASQIPFFEYQKNQPPASQPPSVLHQIRIIQHSWELIHFKGWGKRLWLRWSDRSNSSGMYIGLKSVLNWGHQDFRH